MKLKSRMSCTKDCQALKIHRRVLFVQIKHDEKWDSMWKAKKVNKKEFIRSTSSFFAATWNKVWVVSSAQQKGKRDTKEIGVDEQELRKKAN